jgi:hypothetical protein
MPRPMLSPLLILTACLVLACGESGGTEGATLTECIDGLDNDGDGAIDCLDADCLSYGVCWTDTGPDGYDTSDSWVTDVEPFEGSAVIVNEFMASNAAAVQDVANPSADPSFPDWIELYNTGSSDFDLGGYSITDDLAVPDKHFLAEGLVVPAGGYLLLWADDDEEDEGDSHLGFKLAAEGEEIGLFSPDGEPLCALEYGPQATDYSATRTTDGSMSWDFDATPTPEASNAL